MRASIGVAGQAVPASATAEAFRFVAPLSSPAQASDPERPGPGRAGIRPRRCGLLSWCRRLEGKTVLAANRLALARQGTELVIDADFGNQRLAAFCR